MHLTRGSATTLRDGARLFHALSDETRLAIVDRLRAGERCVCDLQDDLQAAQSRLSFHLRVLREAGLVTDRKSGRWSHYALVPERLAAVAHAISEPAAARDTPRLHQLTRRRPGLAQLPSRSKGPAGCCP